MAHSEGYRKVRVRMRVKSDADAEKLQALARYSPVFTTIADPTPIEMTVVKDH